MAFGMFSSNPFEAFERGYGYDAFNPWTNSSPSFYRQRPQSTRRFVNPSFMWNFPTEIMMSDEEDYPQRKKQYTPSRRKGKCKKCKSKSHQTQSSKDAWNQSIADETLVENNDSSSKSTVDNLDESRLPEHQMSNLRVNETDEEVEEEKNHDIQLDEEEVPRNEEEHSDNYESPEEPETNEITQQAQESMEASNIQETSNDKSESQPEVKTPEVSNNSYELPATQGGSESQKENDDVSEKCEKEENIEDETKTKLEKIELQLKKARELVSNDTFSEPSKTKKQKLYFTEMLLRCILDLDIIETQGIETVKLKRREAVREIQTYLDQVERS